MIVVPAAPIRKIVVADAAACLANFFLHLVGRKIVKKTPLTTLALSQELVELSLRVTVANTGNVIIALFCNQPLPPERNELVVV